MPHPRKEAAAERERAQKETSRVEAARRAEDGKWVVDAKDQLAKESRRRAAEEKAEDDRRKKMEKAALIQEEELSNKGGSNRRFEAPKVKQSDIKISALASILTHSKKPPKIVTVQETELEPNINRQFSGVETGRGTEQSLAAIQSAVGVAGGVDANPERRMKAAHEKYEERRLRELMGEKPGLKRSQYKEMIWKEWQKSPENPLVQAAALNGGVSR
jgi:hypothetical protein